MRYFFFVALAATLALRAGPAGAEGPGIISGLVVDGTAGAPVAGQEVALVSGDDPGQRAVAVTDAQGRFRFAGLPADTPAVYRPEVRFRGVDFTWGPVAVTDAEEGIELELTVYQPAHDPAAVQLVTASLVVAEIDQERQVLRLLQFLVFENAGNTAYVGPPAGGGRIETFQLASPAGTLAVSAVQGLSPSALIQAPGGIAVSQAILPGRNELVLGYDLGYSQAQREVRLQYPFTPLQASVLAPYGVLDVSGPGVRLDGVAELQGGARVARYLVDAGPGPGATVTLGPLPLAERTPTPDTTAGRALAGSVSALALLIAAVYLLRGQRAPASGASETRARAVEQLVALELAREDGRIDGGQYARQRAAILERLNASGPDGGGTR